MLALGLALKQVLQHAPMQQTASAALLVWRRLGLLSSLWLQHAGLVALCRLPQLQLARLVASLRQLVLSTPLRAGVPHNEPHDKSICLFSFERVVEPCKLGRQSSTIGHVPLSCVFNFGAQKLIGDSEHVNHAHGTTAPFWPSASPLGSPSCDGNKTWRSLKCPRAPCRRGKCPSRSRRCGHGSQ